MENAITHHKDYKGHHEENMNDMNRKTKPCVGALHLHSQVMRSEKKSPFF